MSNHTLVPSSPLTIQISASLPEGMTPVADRRFLFFSEHWLEAQTFIGRALKLPISVNDFTTCYGEFVDQAEVQGAVTSMKSVQGLSIHFGNPVMINQKIGENSDYLNSETTPAEIYGHIIWLSAQIQSTARTYHYTLKNLKDIIGPGTGTTAERAARLKLILTGDGGLNGMAKDMKAKTAELKQKLDSFAKLLTTANAGLSEYTRDQSTILQDAIAKCEQLADYIKGTPGKPGLIAKVNEADQEWKDYRISAIAASIGVEILSIGLFFPLAIALGVGLGVKTAEAKDVYNALVTKMKAYDDEMKLKARLIVDLGGLNTVIPKINTAIRSFQDNLSEIEKVWTDIGASFQYIVNNYSDEKLADLPFMMQAADVINAQKGWEAIAKTTEQFIENAFVEITNTVVYGQMMKI